MQALVLNLPIKNMATLQTSILFRQIAGKVARKIVSYVSEGQSVSQGNEMGFIKFGSRVDVFLPPDAELKAHNDRFRSFVTFVRAKVDRS